VLLSCALLGGFAIRTGFVAMTAEHHAYCQFMHTSQYTGESGEREVSASTCLY